MTVPARRSNVAGIVLAAGQSTRFGRNKLIEPLLGMPLVRRVVEAALRSSLSSVTVVLGHDGDTVRATLAGLSDATRLKFAINPSYRKGQSTSVAAGLATVPAGSAGAMFLVGDQPFIDCSTIDRLVAAFEAAGGGICYPVRNGRRCNPVIFGAEFLADLRQLSGDVGGRAVIEANREAAVAVEFSDAALLDDIDSPADLDRVLSAQADRYASPAGSLVQALGLAQARLVALCGAGGKSSLMSALVREWAADRNERVLATTTTKLGTDELCGPWTPAQAGDASDILSMPDANAGALLVYSRRDAERHRLHGFAPDVIDAVAARNRFTRIIVEADGARRLPLKAPGPGEPVFPAATDAVVAVAGLGGLGAPLGADVVFGPDRWARLTGLPLGAAVTAESLARVIVHPEGLMRGAPPQAGRTVFLNQADLPGRAALAETVLDHVASLGGAIPDRAIVGRLRPEPLIHAIRCFGPLTPRGLVPTFASS